MRLARAGSLMRGYRRNLIWLNAADGPILEDRAKPLKRTQQNLREARMIDLPERVGYTVMFLRMTVTEMRKLAENTPEIARELRDIAEQVQVEADSLAGCISE